MFLETPLSAILSLQTIAAGEELHACLVEDDTLTFTRLAVARLSEGQVGPAE